MKVKICGLTQPANIDDVCQLKPDLIGAVFYPQSKRYARESLSPVQMQHIPGDIRKVGVFVNSSVDEILSTVQEFFLTDIQLHGDESVQLINDLHRRLPALPVIKAFQISDDFDFQLVSEYKESCNSVLFDTASTTYGGSGKTFNWDILEKYNDGPPFFLSGGLTCQNIIDAKRVVSSHPLGFGVDVSSGVELEPGIKSLSLVTQFVEEVRK